MTRHRASAAFLIVAVAGVLAACSGTPAGTARPAAGTPPASSPAAPAAPADTVNPGAGGLDACALITPEEVAAATGVSVDAANPTAGDTTATCLYVDDDGSPVVSTVLQAGLAGVNTYLDDAANEPVSGIGDRAVIYQAGGGLPTGRTIYVAKGDRGLVLNVHVEDIDDDAARTILTELATMAAGRM